MKLVLPILTLLFVMSGCSNDTMFEKELNKAKSVSALEEKRKKTDEDQLEDWKEFYSELDTQSVDETLSVYEILVESNNISFDIKDKYDNKDEFARFISHILFSLRRGELTPEKYLSFMNEFGSRYFKTSYRLGEDTDADLQFVKGITEALKQDNLDLKSYQISKVTHDDDNQLKGTFYIMYVDSSGNKKYEQVHVSKEDGVWTLNEVRSSGPVKFKGDGEVLVPENSEPRPIDEPVEKQDELLKESKE